MGLFSNKMDRNQLKAGDHIYTWRTAYTYSHHDEWWMNFGIGDLELQNLAIRILSQTCSSSGCERNWSVFERIHTKRRNRLEHKRLNDLVYTHYNLRLKERQLSRKSLADPISLENIDLTDEWLVEAEAEDAPLLDVDEVEDWMDVADAILDEGEGADVAGIYVGGSKVVHFTREKDMPSSMGTSLNSSSSSSKSSPTCLTCPDCGFRKPNSGVVLSCLDCFLGNGGLCCFEYEVAPSVFLAKFRGGTCTTASPDPPEMVIHRAMYLLQNGFGNYDVFQNNCEDFALYCKTGLLVMDQTGVGKSGQASSLIGAPLAAALSSPLKYFMAGPVGVATVTAGMYCVSRYATDIGVRSDVFKVPVEDVAMNLGWIDNSQVAEENGSPDDEQEALMDPLLSLEQPSSNSTA